MGLQIQKRLFLVILFIYCSCGVVVAVAQDTSTAPTIESISTVVENDKGEQVVFKLSGSHTPKIFRLNGDRPRLVFDFHGVSFPSRINNISDVEGKIIAGVRIGRYEDPLKTRVVVDIQKNSPYQYDQTFNVSNNSLVVTFSSDFPDNVSDQQKLTRVSVKNQKIVHATAEVKEQTETVQPPPAAVAGESVQAAEESPEVEIIGTDSTKKVTTSSQPLTELESQPASEVETQPQSVEPVVETEMEEQQVAEPAVETEMAEQQVAEPAVETEMAEQQVAEPAVEIEAAEQQGAETVAETEMEAEVEATQEEQVSEAEQGEPILLDVSFEKSINNSETVLFRLNYFYPPLVFGIEKGEPRVVCDFMDARISNEIPDIIEARGQFVNRITVTEESDPTKVRVELVLVPNRHYDLQQLYFKEDNLFVVIVKELREEEKTAN